MADMNPARAFDVARRIPMMCDFIETIKPDAIKNHVPVCMPADVGSLGFDTPLWGGLGIVGLWAALDAFAQRADLPNPKCRICGIKCIPLRFASYTTGNEEQSLRELEDLRHLYAHNYAGDADEEYFNFKIRKGYLRHVLRRDVATQLKCGGSFNGRRASLDLPHLRKYAQTVEDVLKRVS
jgi:hypothetical protein